MSVVNAIPMLLGGEGYEISRSVRLRSSASAYLNRTPTVAGNRRTFTFSAWVKRGLLSNADQYIFTSSEIQDDKTRFNTDNTLTFQVSLFGLTTTAVFRDPSAWYHVVFTLDTTQATASNRMNIYINGVQQTSFSSDTRSSITQNLQTDFNNTVLHHISKYYSGAGLYFDGYLAEVNFIDGQALTPSSFGETDSITGVWKPKKYAGTYGTNGFFLNFSDNSAATAAAIGKDYSGNGNNWTPNNISVTAGVTYDSMIDVPTMYADGGNGRGNYCTLNPLFTTVTPTIPLSDGNLTGAASSNSYFAASSTIGVNSGKWYVELTLNGNNATNNYPLFGIDTLPNLAGGNAAGGTASGVSYAQNGQKYQGGAFSAYGSAWSVGTVIGLAVDLDSGTRTATFYLNNVSQGAITLTATTETLLFNFGVYGIGESCSINFGQRPFAYTPPTGFKALNTQNLPDSTIKKGNAYFDVVTRNGSSGPYTTTIDLTQGGMLWDKSRNVVGNHNLIDSVRGISKLIQSNNTNVEGTDATFITAFNNKSFSTGAGDYGSGTTLVDWIWQKSTSAGFDIVTYTGTGSATTVAHSLGVAPKMIIVKQRNAVRGWPVYHASLTSATFYIDLQTTAAQTSASVIWNSTAPTSSVFSVGTDVATNQSSGTYVAYLFSEVAGYSKFGSYTGNGSADGPFVYLGFRPRFLLFKVTSTTGSWTIVDTSRNTYNLTTQGLYPDLSNAEDSSRTVDILSNGFKFCSAANNISGATFIFAAFAENPFKNSLAR